MKQFKQWFEPIGLAFLLFAFGWQCFEERTDQMKIEGYFCEMNEKLIAIWESVYDEALHSDRYHGNAMVSVNYDSMKGLVKDWGQIKEELSTIDSQASLFFKIRVVIYIIGSVLVLLSKWPEKGQMPSSTEL